MEIHADIDVLREMVRLAEMRRNQSLEMIERINKYNLAIIAFSGSFLSILVTGDFLKIVVEISGFFLLVSIVISLITILPRSVQRGGALSIESDIAALKNHEQILLKGYRLPDK